MSETRISTEAGTAVKYRWDALASDRPMPTIERQRVVGEHAMISRLVFEEGCVVPTHAHDNEQFVCIVSGRLRLALGAEDDPARRDVEVGPGEVLVVPARVPHAAVALEATVALDVFSPPSEKTGVDA